MKRPVDNKIHTAAKVVMTVIFLWSGLLWSGVPILYYMADEEYSHISVRLLVGVVLLLAALVLCWSRVYIWQILPCAVGLAVYMNPAVELMNMVTRGRLGDPGFPSFELRYLPMIGFGIISLALFITRTWALISERIEKQNELDNRPTQSILEKRQDDR